MSGVNNTCPPFYGQSILTSSFASWSTGLFFLSSLLALWCSSISCLSQSQLLCNKICIRWKPSVYIFCSLLFYILTDIEFKVSLISLLNTPNKVFLSFFWNLHLTLVHFHKKSCNYFTDVGRGALLIEFTFSSAGFMPFLFTIWPKYNTSGNKNLHFSWFSRTLTFSCLFILPTRSLSVFV